MFRASQGLDSMFNLRREAGTESRGCRRKLEAWRTAATRVWMCWDAMLASPPEGRGDAFAAYTAALDAEAAAADEMAGYIAAHAGVGA
jgi:hypothetical protein